MIDRERLTSLLTASVPAAQPTHDDSLSPIQAFACTANDLFSFGGAYSFKIPDYQRPYVWNAGHIAVFFRDLDTYLKQIAEGHEAPRNRFYFGTILLHRTAGNVYSIIDGQQRLTTLLILDYVLNRSSSLLETKSDHFKLCFGSRISKENIRYNRIIMENNPLSVPPAAVLARLLEYIAFTVIVTSFEDDAFIFFDTQNSRGVTLGATDLLKAYHLRGLRGREDQQAYFARQWDHDNRGQFLQGLFKQGLWRGRRWRGKRVEYEDRDQLLEEFQRRTKKAAGEDKISIFPGRANSFASSSFTADGTVRIEGEVPADIRDARNYPFSLRQPIEKGAAFFLFSSKYAALYRYLFEQEDELEPAVRDLREFYVQVYEPISQFLRQLFELCILLYFDRFGPNQLLAFSLWLDYLLGAYRVGQKSIVEQTPVKILRDEEQNLLDIIANAYLPEEVFEFILAISDEAAYREEEIGEGRRVREQYKRNILTYYGRERGTHLGKKKTWIDEKLNH